jgi:hypothetical protein
MAVETAMAAGGESNTLSAASVLGDIYAWLVELMEDVEHIHDGLSSPGSPWLLLCRGSNILFAWSPISYAYDGSYVDLISRYRKAADTAMAIEAAAGGAKRNMYTTMCTKTKIL